jgi:thiamine biosynthesis protein ThiI
VELGNILARWQGNTTIYLVPFGHAQQEIVTAVPPALRVIIYRRFMMRVAAELAAQSGAGALVTGESLGQVASQTLENMACTEDASTLPVFRPLVGNDKQEIVAEAQRIGTFETSILPYEDCCTLFVPRSPATRATLEECARAEASLDVTNIVQRLVKETEQEHLSREREDA